MSCGAIRLKSLKVSMLSTMSKLVAMISHFKALSVKPVSVADCFIYSTSSATWLTSPDNEMSSVKPRRREESRTG